MTSISGVYISKGNGSFKINDHSDNYQVCQRVVVRNVVPMITNRSSTGLNHTTNSLEKESEFNGISFEV